MNCFKKILIMAVILSATFLFTSNVNAQEVVIINEISWMGNLESHSNEWIELYNPGEYKINLDGWILESEDGSPAISLNGIIQETGLYLLERTDDKTVPNIDADILYRGALENKGEHLKLYNSSGKLVDEIDCSSGWFKGDNESKETMERINELSGDLSEDWQDGPVEGSPKDKNIIKEGENPKAKESEVKSLKRTETIPSLYIFASLIAFFSALIMLILKNKVKRYNDV